MTFETFAHKILKGNVCGALTYRELLYEIFSPLKKLTVHYTTLIAGGREDKKKKSEGYFKPSEPSDHQNGLTPHCAILAIVNFSRTGIYLHAAENPILEGKYFLINLLTVNYGNSVSCLTLFSELCTLSKLSFYPANIFYFQLQTNPPEQHCN